MCVKYCRVTPAITYLYFVFVKKKLQKQSLSAVFFLKAMKDMLSDSPCIFKRDSLEGSAVRRMLKNRIEVPSFFFPMHSDQVTANPESPLHQCILKRNIQS